MEKLNKIEQPKGSEDYWSAGRTRWWSIWFLAVAGPLISAQKRSRNSPILGQRGPDVKTNH